MIQRKFFSIFVVCLCLLAFVGKVEASESRDVIAQHFASSYEYEAKGDFDRSLNEVLKILRIDSKDYVANYRTGYLYYLKGRYSDSIKFYKLAAKQAPRSLEPKLALLSTLIAAQKWSDGAKLGEELMKRWSSDFNLRSRLAYIYAASGKMRQSEELYRDLLTDFPSNIDTMLGLGWVYVKLGRKAKAKTVFERVLVLNRGNLSAKSGLEGL